MKPHKWAKEIKAWADGAEIEKQVIGYHPEGYYWVKENNPDWNDDDAKYRIKPQPKEPQYLYVYKNYRIDEFILADSPNRENKIYLYIGKIKLENEDGE